MSRFRTEFDRIGGPGAVTWWAFFISLADRLITVSVQPVNTPAPVSARIIATIVAQLAMFVPLVLLRFTLLKDPLRPRPWVALLGFSIGDVIRALVVDRLLHELGGIPLYPGLRVFSGFLPTIIPLLITAYVVNTLRERRAQLADLLEVRDRLTAAQDKAASAIQQRNEDLVARVRSVMDRELAALSVAQAAGAVEQLQRTASEVVRPLSHELATSFSAKEEPPAPDRPVRLGWRQVVGDASLNRPLAPVITTILIMGIWIPSATVLAGARWALIISLPILYLSLVGANALLRRVLPRLNPFGRVLTVAVACVAVALLMGGAVRLMVGDWSSATSITFAVIFYVFVMTQGMALVNGVLASRAALVADTTEANDQLRMQVVRTRQLEWFHQRALARALHGPVQSAVTAAALRLAGESQKGALPPDLVEGVRTDLVDVLDVLNAPQSEVVQLDESISRIVTTWDGLCEVRARVEDSAAVEIAADLVTRACIIDILTDAVSNAVRHGQATTVSVLLTCEDGTFTIDVEDNGARSSSGESSGLGSALLDECAFSWALAETGAGHRLHVVLPSVPMLVTV